MPRTAKQVHHEGIKSVGISCTHLNRVVQVIEKINSKGNRTPEGFRIRVNLGDVIEAAIDEFIKKHKL